MPRKNPRSGSVACGCAAPRPPAAGLDIHAHSNGWPGAGVEDGAGVGGKLNVGARGSGVDVGAGIMVSTGVAAARAGFEAAEGRNARIYVKLPQSNTPAIITIAISTLPLRIFFILHRSQVY